MRVKIVKSILWFIVGAAAVVAVARFSRGLGASTAMSDTTPWGFWIGFDVLCGVALAAGGFVIAATVYIFHIDRYKPILRPAVLTAFLGYCAVVGGLLFDLGLPWNLWHAMIYWQPHSALFEVAWCVMLYLTVLLLEFTPVVLEKSPFHKLYKFVKFWTLPLVIVGIMLSTLHQSSLGTLFLIMPFRLHPLWYSPLLPLLFFISAIGLGMGMVCLESLISSWLYKREPERHLLSGLGKAARWVLSLYLVLRVGDLALRGQLGYVFEGSWEGLFFLFEITLCAIFPIAVFSITKARESVVGVGFGAVSIVLGVVVNRLAVGGIATLTATGSRYVPSWMEITISAGVVSGAALAFLFFVEYFKVYEEERKEEDNDKILPEADPVTGVRLGPWSPAWTQYSLAFVLAASLCFAALPDDIFAGAQPKSVPVDGPKLTYAMKTDARYSLIDPARDVVPEGSDRVNVLLLDANRNDRFVLFPHDLHKELHGGESSCVTCHHMNRPLDRASPCFVCHSDMFSPRDTFDHGLHVDKMGGNEACTECHEDNSMPKNRLTVTPCLACHDAMKVEGSMVDLGTSKVLDWAPGYKDAMHNLCIKCHEKNENTELSKCEACHREMDPDSLKRLVPHADEKR